MSEDAFYTQRNSIRLLTSVIKWPKSSFDDLLFLTYDERQQRAAEAEGLKLSR